MHATLEPASREHLMQKFLLAALQQVPNILPRGLGITRILSSLVFCLLWQKIFSDFHSSVFSFPFQALVGLARDV